MVGWDHLQRAFLRRGLALYLFVYHLCFLPISSELWGQGGMIDRSLISPHLHSLLFVSAQDAWVLLNVGLLLALSIGLFFVDFNWIVLSFIFVVHLSLINANPTMIHEPHQIAQLMIVVLALQCAHPKRQETCNDVGIGRIWMAWVFFYYFLSGLKKLPDANWLNGHALEALIVWPGLSHANVFTKIFVALPALLKIVANYFVLLLELSAPFAFFLQRYRRIWVVSALTMHFAIFLTLDVGYFSMIMPIALLSCCDRATRKIWMNR